MSDLYPDERRALEYVRNTNGGATQAHFLEDHEPVGHKLWPELVNRGLVRTDEHGRIHVTEAGAAVLAAGVEGVEP